MALKGPRLGVSLVTPQRAHADRRKADGSKRLTVWLEPATVAALRELRARGAVSDAAAVNAAVVIASQLPEIIWKSRSGAIMCSLVEDTDMRPYAPALSLLFDTERAR